MSQQKLIYMANQIGKFFQSQGKNAVPGIANHMTSFWDPRMRANILNVLESGGAGLDPLVKEALELLKAQRLKA